MSEEPSTRRSAVRAGARRHPLTVFLALVLVPGWALLSVPVLASYGLLPGGRLPVELFALVVTLLVMLPAALWVTWAVDGSSGVRDLWARTVRWRIGLGWWSALLLALPLTTLAVGLALGGSVSAADPVRALLPRAAQVLVALLVVHLWEETVWAGFLQTRLERRHGLVTAALLTALPFTAVHVPLLLLADPGSAGPPGPGAVLRDVGLLLVLAAALRLMVGVVLRAAADSLLAVAVLHAVFNASNNAGGLVDGVLSGADQGLAAAVAVALLTAAAALLVRERLSRAYRAPAPQPELASGSRSAVPALPDLPRPRTPARAEPPPVPIP